MLPFLVLISLERILNDNRSLAIHGLSVGLRSLTEGIHCDPIANMPSTNIFRGAHLIHVGKFIYAFGGRIALLSNGADADNQDATDEVYRYDIGGDSWAQMAPMMEEKVLFTLNQISQDEILITGKWLSLQLKG